MREQALAAGVLDFVARGKLDELTQVGRGLGAAGVFQREQGEAGEREAIKGFAEELSQRRAMAQMEPNVLLDAAIGYCGKVAEWMMAEARLSRRSSAMALTSSWLA